VIGIETDNLKWNWNWEIGINFTTKMILKNYTA